MSPQFAYTLGVVYGDANISIYKSKSSTGGSIALKVKDEDFALIFKKNVEMWSGREARFKKKGDGFYHTILHSINHAKAIKKFSVNNILNTRFECKQAFLSGLFDSEGGVIGHNLNNRAKAKRWVHFSNNNKQIIDIVTSMLDDFNIKYTLKSRIHSGFGSKKLQYEVISYGLRNIVWFHKNKIFNIKRKVNKLKEIIKSYDYYPISLFNEAKKLHKEMGYKKVANEMGLPKGVVYGWLFKNNQKQILDVEV
ncbi:MAG: hypothetical protein KKC75_05935 [Nanoarchaeota archaeon]|nr:hypothetical protein [Nanoarchaeota archaeon]MBU1005703.1 hypothetical protein [Nanoarchaeota archaeon]